MNKDRGITNIVEIIREKFLVVSEFDIVYSSFIFVLGSGGACKYSIRRKQIKSNVGGVYMEKRYLSPEDAAPFLGLSAAAVRKYMRNGSMDLGMVLSPQKTGTKTWRYKIYPEKLKQITGSSVPGYE